MPASVRPLLFALVLLGVGACSRHAPEPAGASAVPAPGAAPASDDHRPPGIAWFNGDVDAAFAAARTQSKPLFLYWGAEWCPPCAQVKAAIFSRREFQERSRLFVPVYLDGDTPSAQKAGERFGVVGYPTMILFRPDGTEITRLPGGVDVERYATILDVALEDARPVADILASASAGRELSANDWRLLAYYSWEPGNDRILPADRQVATFRDLASRCPVELRADCARLYFDYLEAAARMDKSPLSGLDRAESRRQLLDLLGSPSVGAANVDNLLYGAGDVIGVLSDPGTPERQALVDAWQQALARLGTAAGSQPLAAADQVKRLRARVMLAHLASPGAPLPAELLSEARRTIATLDAQTTDPNARQALVNAAANYYWEAGLYDEASRMLTAELDRTKAPFYFMSDLADLAQKAGRTDDAVNWLQRAYDGAHGPATRFQWGYDYLVGLIEMKPGDTQRIQQVGLQVLGELDGSPDAFYQRTRRRLEQLSDKLLDWGRQGEPARVVDVLRTRTAEICRKLPEGDAGRQNCEQFLKPRAAQPATRRA